MVKIFHSKDQFFKHYKKNGGEDTLLRQTVAEILSRVQNEGDAAIRYFTEKFDGVKIADLRIPEPYIEQAEKKLDDSTRNLFETVIENVKRFHEKQKPLSWYENFSSESQYGMYYRPIESVGIYIPGGRAAYPSTVIMTVVPAQIAGVPRIVVTSPPDENGQVNEKVLAVCSLLKIKEIYAVGGAQAIAALGFGTETISRVAKIVGPGNQYVNEAKRQVFGLVGIDALAGPTEIVILADVQTKLEWIVRDLFAQAEHDTEVRAILITPSLDLAKKVQQKMKQLIQTTPRREVVETALKQHGAIVCVNHLEEGVEVANEIAPEHLQIMTSEPETILHLIKNAGAIFLGNFSPAVVGDYFAGPNHVLPTGGSARFSSPLNVLDFMKFFSVVKYSKSQLQKKGKYIQQFARLEGLLNHQLAIASRHE